MKMLNKKASFNLKNTANDIDLCGGKKKKGHGGSGSRGDYFQKRTLRVVIKQP